MSNIASWSYKEGPLTVWPAGGTGEWGVPIGGVPYLIPAIDYIEGGEVGVDAGGTEFTPSMTVWFEAEPNGGLVPEREWYIKTGDHTAIASAPPDAERIRSISGFPMKKFGANQIQDWEIKT